MTGSQLSLYFVFSSRPDIIRKRNVEEINASGITNIKNYVIREFNLQNEPDISVWEEESRQFVLVETDEEVKQGKKFMIHIIDTVKLDKSVINPKYTKKLSDFSEAEQKARIELAAAYRLFDLFGWTDLIYNHLTARIGENEFLLNPFGLLFNEITASSLVKVDIDGNIIDTGCTRFGINYTGYVIHSAIHEARDDVVSVMHCHSTAGVAVASSKHGLLSLTQNAAIVGDVSYHDYEGLSVNVEERERLKQHLGPKNKNMILRNHGLLTCGSSIPEAFFQMYMMNRACEMQVAALSGGFENLQFPDPERQQFTEKTAAKFNPEGVGQKEFDALMRRLDKLDPSYRY